MCSQSSPYFYLLSAAPAPDYAILRDGVQAATRPRAGLSPPDRFHQQVHREPPLPEHSGHRAVTKGGSLCLIVIFPSVRISIN